MERTLPDEVQEIVPSAWVREGVSHGIGRWPSAGHVDMAVDMVQKHEEQGSMASERDVRNHA